MWKRRPERDLAKATWEDGLGPSCGLGKPGGVPSEVPHLLIPEKTLLREVAVLAHPQRTEQLGNNRDWGHQAKD